MAKPLSALDRLLKTPDLPNIVPRLPPDILHRVIQACGLEDSAEVVALATPEQLAQVLDLDIWRVRTGVDEALDADRFGVWIAVLMQAGAAVAADKLAGVDTDLVIAGLARHVAVYDHAAVSSYTTLDGEQVPGRELSRGAVSHIGGYVIEAKLTTAWEPIVELLAFLDAERQDYFHRVMRACVRLSNGAREEDGLHDLLDDDEQALFDLVCDREARRERQGYVSPAQAHAFLREARDVRLDAGRPTRSAIAVAHVRAVEAAAGEDGAARRESRRALPGSSGDAGSEFEAPECVLDVLRESGVFTPPRALLAAGDPQMSRLALLEAHVAAHRSAAEELAYLANAMVAGCSIQGRPFTPREASDGAAAACNLGLENWPPQWTDIDLITAFQVGWTVLHRDVCMYVAERLIDVLRCLRCADRDIHLRLDALRRELTQHVADGEPWRARKSLDAIIMVDAPAWAALLAAIAECPVIHAAVRASGRRCRRIDPADFAFIAQNSDIGAVRQFMASLPTALTR